MREHVRTGRVGHMLCVALLIAVTGATIPSQASAETWYSIPEIFPDDPLPDSSFGWSVSMSGHTAFIGAIDRSTVVPGWPADASGAVYVYELQGQDWIRVQKIVPSGPGAGWQKGFAVSVRNDRAIIGAYEDDGVYPIYGRGNAFIYEKVGGTWVEVAVLQPSDMENADGFGRTVDIAGDWAVVGAQHATTDVGEINVYQRKPTGWERVAVLTADAASGDLFGTRVSIIECGICAVGTTEVYIAASSYADGGSVYVYQQNIMTNPSWEWIKLTGSDTISGDNFGLSISMDETGGSYNHLIVGAPDAGGVGAAYVFRNTGDLSWTEIAKLTPSDGQTGDAFGAGVSIHSLVASNEWRAVVGSRETENEVGAGYVFSGSGSSWLEEAKLTRDTYNYPPDSFGSRVAIDERTGDAAVMGAPSRNGVSNRLGAAYFFVRGCLGPLVPQPTAPTGICVDSPATLTWDPVAGATAYEVQLGTLCGSGATYSTPQTQYAVSGLDIDETYQWRVRSQSDCGAWSQWSNCVWFRVAPPVPGPTLLSSPPDGATGVNPEFVILEWGDLTPATMWQFELGSSCASGSAIDTNVPEADLPVLPMNETFYWRVRSQNECEDWGPWSECFSFTTFNTSTGTDVTVEPGSDITLEFDEVLGGGDTTVETLNYNPGPDVNSYMFMGTFYDINTTASYDGNVRVCLHYDDTGLTDDQERELALFHFEDTDSDGTPDDWVNIMTSVNIVDNIICGVTQSLSPFGMALFMPWRSDATTPELATTDNTAGVSWGDYDGDGDPDLYISNHLQADKLFRNDGSGVFTDVTASPLGHMGQGSVGCWADYDNDGDSDLYLTVRGGANVLYENTGLAFVDATEAPLDDVGESHGAAWFDYDNDGDLDVYVSNYYQANRLYRNDGRGAFTDVSAAPIDDVGQTTSAAIADYDDDGDPDMYITNTGSQPNRLYRNDGGGIWTDVTPSSLSITTESRGAAWGDYDNDGDLDLYVANGSGANQLFRNDGSNVFAEVSFGALADPGSARAVGWQDYDNDGDLDLYIVNVGSANKLIRNEGWGVFTDGTVDPLGDTGLGIGAAWADYDQDGDSDLYLANTNGPNVLFRNDQGSLNHWLHVRLSGTATNRAGIGARVRVVSGSLDQMREVHRGSGYLSETPATACFGLGSNVSVDRLEVHWPSGTVTTITTGIGIDRVVTIAEGATNVPSLPGETRLHAPSPNPFNPRTTVSFDLAETGPVTLRIYDSTGRLIRTLLDGVVYEPGTWHQVWNGTDSSGRPVASGVYHVRLEATGMVETKSVALIK